MGMRWISSFLVLIVLAACGSGEKKIVIPKIPKPVVKEKPLEVRVALLEGPALPMARLLSQSVVDGLNDFDIKATVSKGTQAPYVLEGRAEANWEDRRVPFVMLVYWTLKDGDGNKIGQYTQGVRGARWRWEFGDPRIIRAVGNGAAKPVAAMVGEKKGEPLPFVLIGAGMLVQRVEGAPGDGNRSLTAAIKEALRNADVSITNDIRQASVVLKGTVTVEPAATPGRDRISIVWKVTALDGFEVGSASQDNIIRAGSLDGPWGGEAAKVAAAAVVGIERILGSGAKRSSSPQGIVEEVPPSLEKLEQIPGRAPPPPQ